MAANRPALAVPRLAGRHDEGRELEDRVDGDLDRVEYSELAWVAWRRMMRAVLRGDAAGALRWGRVHAAVDAVDADLKQWVRGEHDDMMRMMQAPLAHADITTPTLAAPDGSDA